MYHQKDARRMFTKESQGLIKMGLKPDGTMPEMDRGADILVYEVFDSGLIGEGCDPYDSNNKHTHENHRHKSETRNCIVLVCGVFITHLSNYFVNL